MKANRLRDKRVVDCAVHGGADYLVTGDNGILALEIHRGICVLTPVDFARTIAADSTDG